MISITKPIRPPEAAVRFGSPHASIRPGRCLRTLALIVLVAFIHHILIFHPFSYSMMLDARGLAPLYDAGSHAEVTDENDTTSFHNRCGVQAPVLNPGISTTADPLFVQLLLNAAAEHPPKTSFPIQSTAPQSCSLRRGD